jgi:molybdenum-dependent DNA-binding transcriptional regulator ModE
MSNQAIQTLDKARQSLVELCRHIFDNTEKGRSLVTQRGHNYLQELDQYEKRIDERYQQDKAMVQQMRDNVTGLATSIDMSLMKLGEAVMTPAPMRRPEEPAHLREAPEQDNDQ